MAAITFYGVRGSTPCACDSVARYGGNTSCVVITSDDHDPVILDLGTGLRFYGLDHPFDQPFRGTALLTHLHWDHVQGIPFFSPLLVEGASLSVYGPPQEVEDLAAAVRRFVRPPYFPVGIDDLPGEITFHDAPIGTFELDGCTVEAAWVPHVGPTLGFRVTTGGVTIAYVSDHQQPGLGATEVDPAVLDLCQGADVLVHDAQFDDLEFSMRSDWGHCTADYAVEVAAQAEVRTLVLFHHDPAHTDLRVDELLAGARRLADERGVEQVLAASEGLCLQVDAPAVADPTASGRRRRGSSQAAAGA
jgi:ribonuclease BN (tRNA processing enzyme)